MDDNEEMKQQIKNLLLMRYSTHRRRGNVATMGRTQQKKYKKEARELFEIAIESLNSIGFRFESIIVLPKTGDPETDKHIPLKINFGDETKTTTIKDVLLAKDKICLSDNRYHEFRRDLDIELPALSQIKKKRKLMNNSFVTTTVAEGAYVNIEAKMKTILKRLTLEDNVPLKIKFSGDGTVFGHVNKNLNVTFTILNEGKKAKTASGNYLIGTFMIEKEDYCTVEKCLKGIIEQIENLNEITISEKVYKIEKYFGGDLKFLAIMLGINAANSNQPCIWCTYDVKKKEADKKYREQSWSISDKSLGARSIEDSVITVSSIKQGNDILSNGYINEPLIKSIPTSKYVIDMLHLFLRISDKLYSLFYENLQVLDALDKYNREHQQSRVKKFLNDLSSKFKIVSPYRVCKTNETIVELRSLRGPEKERIFRNVKLGDYAIGYAKLELLEKVWNDFWYIYNLIKTKDLTADEVKMHTAEWMVNFRSLYFERHVTPYMHSFEHHLHEFIKNENDVNLFNQQGLEKLNSMTGYSYEHGTNKKRNYCTQLINRQNRLDLKHIDED